MLFFKDYLPIQYPINKFLNSEDSYFTYLLGYYGKKCSQGIPDYINKVSYYNTLKYELKSVRIKKC